MTEQNYDTDNCVRIGLLALDQAGHQTVSELLKNPLLQGIPIEQCSLPDKANPEQVIGDNENSFLNLDHRPDILFILADIEAIFKQEKYAGILSQIGCSDTLIFTIPLAPGIRFDSLIYDHALDHLTIENHALLIEQSNHSIDQRSPTVERSFINTKISYHNLALIIYGIIGPLIHPGLISTDLMEIQALLSQNTLVDVYLAEGNGSDRAPNMAHQILDNWRNSEHRVTSSNAMDVLITLIHGNDFTLSELDEAAAVLLPVFPEYANCKFAEALNLTLDEQMATVMFVGRPNLSLQPRNDQSLGIASMLFNTKNREAV